MPRYVYMYINYITIHTQHVYILWTWCYLKFEIKCDLRRNRIYLGRYAKRASVRSAHSTMLLYILYTHADVSDGVSMSMTVLWKIFARFPCDFSYVLFFVTQWDNCCCYFFNLMFYKIILVVLRKGFGATAVYLLIHKIRFHSSYIIIIKSSGTIIIMMIYIYIYILINMK